MIEEWIKYDLLIIIECSAIKCKQYMCITISGVVSSCRVLGSILDSIAKIGSVNEWLRQFLNI